MLECDKWGKIEVTFIKKKKMSKVLFELLYLHTSVFLLCVSFNVGRHLCVRTQIMTGIKKAS